MKNSKKRILAISKDVIPTKAGIHKLLTSLDSRACGSDRYVPCQPRLAGGGKGEI